MSINFLLFFFAAVCFGLDAFRIPGRVSWTPAGFCLLTIAIWLL